MSTPQGIADRLRSAAMAEIQAREAFAEAADRFDATAPAGLLKAWRALSRAENKHLGWLCERIEALGERVDGRTVSDQLYRTLSACSDAEDFARYMALAETRGMRAGELFQLKMASVDPLSARLFGVVAQEEAEHIRLAERWFPNS